MRNREGRNKERKIIRKRKKVKTREKKAEEDGKVVKMIRGG